MDQNSSIDDAIVHLEGIIPDLVIHLDEGRVPNVRARMERKVSEYFGRWNGPGSAIHRAPEAWFPYQVDAYYKHVIAARVLRDGQVDIRNLIVEASTAFVPNFDPAIFCVAAEVIHSYCTTGGESLEHKGTGF